MQLTKVGDTDVTGLGYRDVADVIKSHTERLLRRRLCLGAAPQVATVTVLRKVTPEELVAASKKATEEGIWKVMEAVLSSRPGGRRGRLFLGSC